VPESAVFCNVFPGMPEEVLSLQCVANCGWGGMQSPSVCNVTLRCLEKE
jgi:hypothetical protein